MADQKISAMTPVAAAAPTDEHPVVQGGANRKETNAQVAAGGFVGQTVNAATFSASTTLQSGIGSDGILKVFDAGAIERLAFSTVLGLSSLIIKDGGGVDTVSIDSNGNSTFVLSVNTVNVTAGDGTTSGLYQLSGPLGVTATLSVVNVGGTFGGTLTLKDDVLASRVVINGADGSATLNGDVEITQNSDVKSFIIRSTPGGVRYRLLVDDAGNLGTAPA